MNRMVTVLIVEDEYLVRVGLRTCIDWESHGFTLLNDAVDGESAYQKILLHKPDIMLLDIKMPRMNGFELLEKLQNDGLSINTIILSCCDDFESMRTALQFGVKDYINKLTLNPSDLLSVLNKITVSSLTASTTTSTPSTEGSLASIPEPAEIFSQIINRVSHGGEDSCGLFPSGYVACVLVTPNKPASTLSPNILLNMTFQTLKNNGIESISCLNDNGLITLLLPAASAENHIFATLKANLESALDALCAIGYSNTYCSTKDIFEKYTYARQIEYAVFWEDYGRVQSYSQLLTPTDEFTSYCSEIKKNIKRHIIAKDPSGTIQLIDQFFGASLYINTLTPNDFIQYAQSILKLFYSDALEDSYFHHQKSMIQASSISTVKRELHSFVSLYFSAANVGDYTRYSPVITKAIEYIITNPSRFIQLSEAAQHVNISEPYLSQLFKKETGVGFITYVHKYKIELAKTMLNNQLLIYETCERLGFENANYFSKIFKRFTGMSPKEYRNQVKNDTQ